MSYITDPLYLPLKRGGPVCPPLEGPMIFNEPEEICENQRNPWENISSLKESKKFGGVRGKIYLCITLSCTRQIESKALFALVGKVFA